MPFRIDEFQTELKDLKTEVRTKAMEIAQKLVDQGYERRQAVDEAISRARKWAENVGRAAATSPRDEDGARQHVMAFGTKWGVKREGADEPRYLFEERGKAVEKGVEIARFAKSDLVIHDEDGGVRETRTYS